MFSRSHADYNLYKKKIKTGLIWYIRFWDKTAKKYIVTRSSGILVKGKGQHRREADEVARALLPTIIFDKPRSSAVQDTYFIQYISSFWALDSQYIREKALIDKMPLSVKYIKMNRDDVERHIKPFPPFQNLQLRELTPRLIRDWMLWGVEKGMSGCRINACLKTMRIPVRYAISREDLDKDPFQYVGRATEQLKEKGVLSAIEVRKFIGLSMYNSKARLIILLGVLCGMRRGEIRGLLWQDIGDGLIFIRHNWQDDEGLKCPKKGSIRTVPIPMSVQNAIEAVRKDSINPSIDNFILQSLQCPGKPLSNRFFAYSFTQEMVRIGISAEEQKKRHLSFHSLRHTFITLSRLAGISDIEIQALAGHKGVAMMEHYSHASQVLDFDAAREKIERAVGEKSTLIKEAATR